MPPDPSQLCPSCFVVRYWSPHPCGGYYLEAAHHWTEKGQGDYAY